MYAKKGYPKIAKGSIIPAFPKRGKNHCYTAHALYAQQLLQTDMFAKDELPKENGYLDYDLIDPDSFD